LLPLLGDLLPDFFVCLADWTFDGSESWAVEGSLTIRFVCCTSWFVILSAVLLRRIIPQVYPADGSAPGYYNERSDARIPTQMDR
jgi:hypothetical protein